MGPYHYLLRLRWAFITSDRSSRCSIRTSECQQNHPARNIIGLHQETRVKYLLLGIAISCMLLTHPLMAHADQVAHATAAVPGWTEAPYNPQNPFAKIIRGELRSYKVYEDAHVLAFLSLNQDAPGHVLVISKASRAQNIMEMSPPDLIRVMLVARRIARAEVVALHADGIAIRQNNGAAGGQTVFHLHVHVEPHWNGKPPDFARDAQGKLDRRAMAVRIAAAIRS